MESPATTATVSPMLYAEEILTAVIATRQAPPITYEQNEGPYSTRAQVHAILEEPFGSGKTTSLSGISDSKITVELNTWSYPGMVGTITKDGMYHQGALVRACGKVLIADEIQRLDKGARNALLEALEEQRCTRALGYNAVPKQTLPFKKTKAGLIMKVQVNAGQITTFSRFSCICAGAHIVKAKPDLIDKMWLSRFIPIRIEKDLDDIYAMLRGEKKIKIKIIDDYIYPITIPNPVYYRMLDRHEEIVRKSKFAEFFKKRLSHDPGWVSRNFNDIARIAAVHSVEKGIETVTDEEAERALNLVPVSMYNLARLSLTEMEYKIISLHKKFDGKEIAEQCGITQQAVSKHISRLEQDGLIFVKK